MTELGHEHVIKVENRTLTVKSGLYHDLKTSFDLVLENSSQSAVYEQAVQPIIPQFLNGYNCTVFTYG